MDIPSLAIAPYFIVALTLCMVWVVVSDARNYIIPNILNAVILGLYVVAALVVPIPGVAGALGAAAIMLLIGLGMFTLGLMGGGDIKLLVVLTLWTGWHMATPQFIFLTAIFGGLLVIVVLALRVIVPPLWIKLRPKHNLPRILTKKQPVPYGIAIAGGFSWLLWTNSITGLSQ